MSPRLLFRVTAIAEAITWTGLITALVARAVGGPEFVTIAGGVHGFVFLSYAVVAVLVAVNQRWRPGIASLAVATAIVPFATIPVDVWLDRSGRLDGAWRTEATEDPRDRHWFDRFVRWWLRRPILLVVVAVVGVVVLFVTLLVIGPPGGRH